MFRASNLVPRSTKKWSGIRQLSRSSVEFNKSGMILKIKWSKTIQFRQRILEIPVFAIPGSILCPVRAVRRVLKISKASSRGPLLAISNSKMFTYGMLQRKLKEVINRIGLDKTKYSSHSMRRGAVLWAQKNSVPEPMIKLFGDWSSDCYKRYLQFPEETRVAVGRKMVQKLKKNPHL